MNAQLDVGVVRHAHHINIAGIKIAVDVDPSLVGGDGWSDMLRLVICPPARTKSVLGLASKPRRARACATASCCVSSWDCLSVDTHRLCKHLTLCVALP